jgi:hypothetical protein
MAHRVGVSTREHSVSDKRVCVNISKLDHFQANWGHRASLSCSLYSLNIFNFKYVKMLVFKLMTSPKF